MKKIRELILDVLWDWSPVHRQMYEKMGANPLNADDFEDLCRQEGTLLALRAAQRLERLEKRIELLGMVALEEKE